MPRYLLLPLVLLLAACAGPTPYAQRLAGPPAPSVPVPTAEHPNARNYLPVVLRATTEAEFPLFDALNNMPLEKTRPLLEALDIIRDDNGVPRGDSFHESGEDRAVNDRFRVRLHHVFSTAQGPRIAWILSRPNPGWNQWSRQDSLFLLTTDDYQPLCYKQAYTLLAASVSATKAQSPESFRANFISPYKDAPPPESVTFHAGDIEFTSPEPPKLGQVTPLPQP